MPKYRCLIHGTGYVLRRDSAPQELGFWTTRDVIANTPTKASEKALDVVRNDKSLEEHMVPHLCENARLYVDSISRLRRPTLRKPKGFTFYYDPDEKEN